MPQFLFVVEFPASKAQTSPAGHPSEWTQFENETNTIPMLAKTCKRHQKNAWLLPVENGMPLLLGLTNLAVKHDLSYSVLFLPSDAVPMTTATNKS